MALAAYGRILLSPFLKLFRFKSAATDMPVPVWDTAVPSIMICGLGNLDIPETRHSVGMKAVDHLAKMMGISWVKKQEFKAMVAVKTLEALNSGTVETNDITFGDTSTVVKEPRMFNVVLLKSTLPMNLNGKSLKKAAQHFNTNVEDIFLIQDELDKKVGKFSIKEGGSARGHNGVRSVADCFNTECIHRLLIGIDRPKEKSQVVDYVLSRWSQEEQSIIENGMNDFLSLLLKRIEKKTGLGKIV